MSPVAAFLVESSSVAEIPGSRNNTISQLEFRATSIRGRTLQDRIDPAYVRRDPRLDLLQEVAPVDAAAMLVAGGERLAGGRAEGPEDGAAPLPGAGLDLL